MTDTRLKALVDGVTKILPHPMEPGDEFWVISICGYGWFLFVGNEADCELMRAGRAEWEGATGSKWRCLSENMPEPRLDRTYDALCCALENPTNVATWRNYGRAEEVA